MFLAIAKLMLSASTGVVKLSGHRDASAELRNGPRKIQDGNGGNAGYRVGGFCKDFCTDLPATPALSARLAPAKLTRKYRFCKSFRPWSCGREAEGGGLLNRYTL